MKKSDPSICEAMGLGGIDRKVKEGVAEDTKRCKTVDEILKKYSTLPLPLALTSAFYLGAHIILFSPAFAPIRKICVELDLAKELPEKEEKPDDAVAH